MSRSVRERVLEGFDDPNAREDGISDFVRDLKATHPPAAAGLLARMMPSGDAEDGSGCGIIGDVIIQSIPNDHMICPDGKTRPTDEAEKLWAAENKTQPAIMNDKPKSIAAISDTQFADGELIEASDDNAQARVQP